VKEGDRIGKNQAVALVERDEVGVKFEPAPVPSTLTGVVARVYLDRGANVTLSTPVALVVDQGQMQVRAEIPERYAGKVSLGKDVRVKVDAHADKTFEGKISRLSPVVDTSTRTTYMEAALENPAGLLQSGMFAKLNVVIAKKNGALAVPLDSVIETNDAVFVAENGIARRRPVELGLRTENHAEVIKGLNEGEAVVTFGLFGLKDGSPVEILK
jgi:RND family efflux transporter MFP subunit